MVLDIIILLIVLYGAVLGFKRGFSKTIFSIVGWLISVIGAYIATPFVKDYLIKNTDYLERFAPSATSYSSVPAAIAESFSEITANIILTVAIYAAVFIAIKIFMWLIIALITRHDRKSFAGMIDGIFGMIFGILKGAIIACILVAIILPLCDVFAPALATNIENMIDTSYIAKLLYDNNPIYLFLKGFFLG